MKARTLISILTFIFSLLLISSCATTPETKEEREGVNQELFFKSVKSGDYAEVKRLIEAGADVNAKVYNEYTVLMTASYDGHREIAKLLIEEGADVNDQCQLGYTALMEASVKGHTEIVKLLIEEGADVNTKDNQGTTASMFASRGGFIEIVKLLREAGARR